MSSSSELKGAFWQIHDQIVASVNAASVIDRLFQEEVITSDDYDALTEH